MLFKLSLFIQKLIAQNKELSILYKFIFKIFYLKNPSSSTLSSVELFDYQKISQRCKNNYISPIRDNNLYGTEETFRKFLSSDINNVLFEHGVIFGSLLPPNTRNTYAEKIVTFGKFRGEILKKEIKYKEIIEVGPYIHYADDFLGESELKELKKKLGSVVLVFPSHSTKTINVKYDVEIFCERICKKTSNYDTKVVCLYWKDIELGLGRDYESKGFIVTCAGYANNSFFLSRLRTIIKISDMVIANDIGTFIGYSVYFEKRVVLIPQSTVLTRGRFDFSQERRQWEGKQQESLDKMRTLLFDLFSEDYQVITKSQYDLCSFIWGFDKIKSSEDLVKLLKNN